MIKNQIGVVFAIVSAILFGLSTPFAKLILGEGVNPWLLAGILYLGSGFGLSIIYGFRHFSKNIAKDAPLRVSDLPWLFLVVLFGGGIAPILLMIGLAHTQSSTASLLLNIEGLATMLIAWLVFKENVDKRLLIGAFAILLGGVLLSFQGGTTPISLGAIAIFGACLAWGIDNNLTRKLSSSDPLMLALIKGLVAGIVNICLASLYKFQMPALNLTISAAFIGFLGYGISLVCFIMGLRYLGSARTGAYFSTAPFIGAIASILIFHEPLSLKLILSGVLMAFGLYLHLTEEHNHEHHHEAMEHEHLHYHDEHHQHEHSENDPKTEPHSHFHKHEPLTHKHKHYPDIHHRHEH